MKIVYKGWGREEWVVNKPAYCGKILYFLSGKRCSFHHHRLKDETFFLRSGKLMLLFSDGDDLESASVKVLFPGDSFHVSPGLRHQMIGLEESELIEFSTEHFDEDSYRIIKGD